ncbi:MAG: energy-coupling factor transporter transmembrane component T [Eubacteriaceae bacterium]
MFKDITIGQYYPANSSIHDLDPRTKIVYTFVYIIVLFFANNIVGYTIALGFLALLIYLSNIPLKFVFKSVKAIIIIIFITVILNVFVTNGNILFRIGPLKVTDAGLINAAFMAVRLIMLIIGTSIMTLTTSPISLTDGMEYCMRRIPGMRAYAHELAMMMTIALRFIPTLMEEADKIMKAQKARGADFETGGIFKKAKSVVPILVPLFIGSFKRADELAMAMEARCYRGGEGRTRLNELVYGKGDTVAYIVTVLMTAMIIASRFLPLLNIPMR